MAKKRTEAPLNTCRDCKNCHSHYSEGYDGRMILGKCSKSEHSKLLNRDTCKEFTVKSPLQEFTEKEARRIPEWADPQEVDLDTRQIALFK